VCDICDEESMLVTLFGLNADAGSSTAGRNVGMIDSHIDRAAVRRDESRLLCGILIDIVDISMGWVILLEQR
jgi:hypothetical protein